MPSAAASVAATRAVVADQRHVPGAGKRNRQRKDRAVAVDHVLGEDQRDAVARAGDGDLLPGPDRVNGLGAEQRAELAVLEPGTDVAAARAAGLGPLARTQKVELADLLGQRHPLHQTVDELLRRHLPLRFCLQEPARPSPPRSYSAAIAWRATRGDPTGTSTASPSSIRRTSR